MFKRLLTKALVERILKRRDVWDEATQRRIKGLEYKLSVTKHSVRRKQLLKQLRQLKGLHHEKKTETVGK